MALQSMLAQRLQKPGVGFDAVARAIANVGPGTLSNPFHSHKPKQVRSPRFPELPCSSWLLWRSFRHLAELRQPVRANAMDSRECELARPELYLDGGGPVGLRTWSQYRSGPCFMLQKARNLEVVS